MVMRVKGVILKIEAKELGLDIVIEGTNMDAHSFVNSLQDLHGGRMEHLLRDWDQLDPDLRASYADEFDWMLGAASVLIRQLAVEKRKWHSKALRRKRELRLQQKAAKLARQENFRWGSRALVASEILRRILGIALGRPMSGDDVVDCLTERKPIYKDVPWDSCQEDILPLARAVVKDADDNGVE